MNDEEYKAVQIDVEDVIMARQKQIIPQAIESIPADEVITPISQDAGRDLANQLLGRIQLAQSFEKLLTVSRLLDIQTIKETKSYKHLRVIGEDGKVLTISSFDDFCGCLGISPQHVNEQLRNLEAFGADAYKSLQDIGLSYKQFRELRKAPDNIKQLVIEQVSVDLTDNESAQESILELLETQTKKHEREKAELKAKAEIATRALEVKDKVIAQKTAEIQKRDKTVAELEEQNAKLSGANDGVDGIDMLNNKLADKLSTLVNKTLSVDFMLLRKLILEVQQANAPEHIQLQCGAVVVQLIADLQAIQTEYQLDMPSVINTSWMDNIPDDVQD